jgi:trehalose 6-phosphate synthase
VLILSRFAGPYDPDSVATAIGQALAMPLAERRGRHDSLFRVLSQNDVQHWANRFVAARERKPKTPSQLGHMHAMRS